MIVVQRPQHVGLCTATPNRPFLLHAKEDPGPGYVSVGPDSHVSDHRSFWTDPSPKVSVSEVLSVSEVSNHHVRAQQDDQMLLIPWLTYGRTYTYV